MSWERCRRCESNRVIFRRNKYKVPKRVYVLVGISLIFSLPGLLLILEGYGFFHYFKLLVFPLILGLIATLVFRHSRKVHLFCKDCHLGWKPER